MDTVPQPSSQEGSLTGSGLTTAAGGRGHVEPTEMETEGVNRRRMADEGQESSQVVMKRAVEKRSTQMQMEVEEPELGED